MNKNILEDFKKRDRELRVALGNIRREFILGQFSWQDEFSYYLVALDRQAFLSQDATDKGFLLTTIPVDDNFHFDLYLDVVDDMFSIGHVDVKKESGHFDEHLASLKSISKKLNKFNENDIINLTNLNLNKNEKWFENYATGSRWEVGDISDFTKRELLTSVYGYEIISSIVKQKGLDNSQAPQNV